MLVAIYDFIRASSVEPLHPMKGSGALSYLNMTMIEKFLQMLEIEDLELSDDDWKFMDVDKLNELYMSYFRHLGQQITMSTKDGVSTPYITRKIMKALLGFHILADPVGWFWIWETMTD